MKIKEIWVDADYIYGRDEDGKEYKQRGYYTFGSDGIHWREL